MTRSPLTVVRRAQMPRPAKSNDASYGELFATIVILTAIAALAALLDHLFGE